MSVTWREAFLLVGFLCAVAGIFIREIHTDVRGMGMALFVVGIMLMILGPMGSIWGWW